MPETWRALPATEAVPRECTIHMKQRKWILGRDRDVIPAHNESHFLHVSDTHVRNYSQLA